MNICMFLLNIYPYNNGINISTMIDSGNDEKR